jgi:pimeloyl-ACP methyl ester carboxylesterase
MEQRRTVEKRLKTRIAALAAGVAVAALVLSGCAPETGAVGGGESAAQQRAFPAVYEQSIEWGACDASFGFIDELEDVLVERGARIEGLRCAMVEAPLDWNDPDNLETIELATMHIPATGDEPIGTLLSNPGGPGASGLDFVLGMTIQESFAAVQEHYDLLGFDPRGIARSAPLQCESESTIFELRLAMCADQDPLASSMGSAQVARDMELLRHLMGDDTMHYAGFSYGTVIGASYATLFPERVGRLLLDSAWPSDWSSPLGSYEQFAARSAALVEMLAQCGVEYEVSACPIGGEDQLMQLMATLAAQPLLATDGTPVDGGVLYGYLTTALYQLPAGRELVLERVARSLGGDQAAVDEIAEAMAGGGAAVGLSGMVVRCLSSPRDANLVGLVDFIETNGLPRLLGGPEITDDTLRQFVDLKCEALPDSGEDFMVFSNDGDAPILVMGITGDHATPYAGAQQLVDELGNARLLTLDGRGHIASFGGRSSCADAAAIAYLVDGELPPEGTVCTDD